MARDAESGESAGEAGAARPSFAPSARRRAGETRCCDDGRAVGVDESGALKEADGRQGHVVGGAQHGAIHRRNAHGVATDLHWDDGNGAIDDILYLLPRPRLVTAVQVRFYSTTSCIIVLLFSYHYIRVRT